MADEIPKLYEPAPHERRVTERWLEADAFAAVPDRRDRRYVIMMPLPNVTGALHMGHAMDNVMQDLLIRWRRMAGDNTLWMPGTDHAGIATQAVVEKRLFELEGKTRHDLGRDALVARIWAWKDEYQARIIRQQQRMGCSCDWKRRRFTMDAVCAGPSEAFFRLFAGRLICRATAWSTGTASFRRPSRTMKSSGVRAISGISATRSSGREPANGIRRRAATAQTMLGDGRRRPSRSGRRARAPNRRNRGKNRVRPEKRPGRA